MKLFSVVGFGRLDRIYGIGGMMNAGVSDSSLYGFSLETDFNEREIRLRGTSTAKTETLIRWLGRRYWDR